MVKVKTRIDLATGDTTTLDVDLVTGEAVEQVNGQTIAAGPYDPVELEALRADDRERRQEQRLQTNFQQLRQTPPAASLTNAELRDEVDLLRAMLLDLTRVVRGIAAE